MVNWIGRACALLASVSIWTIIVDAFSVESFCRQAVQQRQGSNTLRMVAIEPSFASKYPTARGSEVDSRKIVAGRQKLTAVRLSHIIFASEEMAVSSLKQLRSASVSFDELAKQISNCVETRQHGGSIGWVAVDDDTSVNEHLDLVLPPEARKEVLQLSTKVKYSIFKKVVSRTVHLHGLVLFHACSLVTLSWFRRLADIILCKWWMSWLMYDRWPLAGLARIRHN
jgi:hypothetical protein